MPLFSSLKFKPDQEQLEVEPIQLGGQLKPVNIPLCSCCILKKISAFMLQVVFAEAQAAGLFKGGIRRAAFSMSDLQALQPPESSLPPRSNSQR